MIENTSPAIRGLQGFQFLGLSPCLSSSLLSGRISFDPRVGLLHPADERHDETSLWPRRCHEVVNDLGLVGPRQLDVVQGVEDQVRQEEGAAATSAHVLVVFEPSSQTSCDP